LQIAALVAADIPSLDASKITTGLLALARGGTGADLSATGGANQVLKQTTAGGAVSVATLVAADIPSLDASKITSGTFAVARGGTGLSSIAAGGILYASALDTLSRIAPTAANQVLRSTAANALEIAALVAADIPSLDASKITSGTFAVARGGTGLSSIAAGGILYASAADTLSRIAPSAANQVLRSTAANALQIAALVAADIPSLDAAKITSGRFGMARMPDGTSGYFLKAQGTGVDPVYAAGLTFTELAGFEAKKPSVAGVWEDWDLSAIIGAGAKLVQIDMLASGGTTFGARKNGSALVRSRNVVAGESLHWLVECDANRVIELYYGNLAYLGGTNIMGYWS
jgi:hypothetical protein